VITGAHTVIYSRDAEADRAFFRDVLDLPSVDAGGGWLIFGLPAGEAAFHPAGEQGGTQELYLMCDDIRTTVAQLRERGAEFSREVSDERWGLVTAIRLPSGAELHLYEPRHPTP
jgi:catechol 2,3-dioxygenase-like lactoylglutathione lyase family enzyme